MKRKILAILFMMSAPLAQAVGLATTAPTVLYDSHSQEAQKLFVVAPGHPLRQIARVDGWRKVSTYNDKTGWVRENEVRPWSGAVVIADNVAIRSAAANQSSTVFYAKKGVVLEMLRIKGAWVEILHKDGETGYILINQVWLNNPLQ